MQAIRVAQKSDPDLLIEEPGGASETGDAATPAESTITTISSRPPTSESVDDTGSSRDESLGSLRINMAPFIEGTAANASSARESISSVRINTPTFASPPVVAPRKVSRSAASAEALAITPSSRPARRVTAVAVTVIGFVFLLLVLSGVAILRSSLR